RTARLTPAIRRDRIGNQLGDVIDELLAGLGLGLDVGLAFAAAAVEQVPAAAALHSAAAAALADVAHVHNWSGEVWHIHDQVANVIYARQRVSAQVLFGRDRDHAF